MGRKYIIRKTIGCLIVVAFFIVLMTILVQENHSINPNTQTFRRRVKGYKHWNALPKAEKQNINALPKAEKQNNTLLTHIDFKYYEPYLKYKNLDEFSDTLPDLSKSNIKIVNNFVSYNIGQNIVIKINLYNVHGKQITKGGDWLKIWIREPNKVSGSAGYVIDHNNGTYTGIVQALWSGSLLIKISMSFPKEAIGLFVNDLSKYGMLFKIYGVFKNNIGDIGYSSCGFQPSDNSCDFTLWNFGMRWYCTLPESKGFTCADWLRPDSEMTTRFSDDELAFLRSSTNKMFKEITVNIIGDYKDPQQLCLYLLTSNTWNNKPPVGYYHDNKWHNLQCKDGLPATKNVYKQCLHDREIYMIGDSSLRMWFISMVKFLNLNLTIGPPKVMLGKPWHKLIKAESKIPSKDKIRVVWAPHELPFFTFSSTGVKDNFKPAEFYIENIHSENPIVILHWYLHFAPILPSVFEEHVRNAKYAIIKFLKRVPKATVLIKGPHNIDLKENQGVPHDFVRYYQEDILFNTFEDMKDKVIFLNEWDITVASESKKPHPEESINLQMIHNFMTLIC